MLSMLFLASTVCPVFAATATSLLSGTVTIDGAGVPGATVTVSGNRQTLRAMTDARGQFSFASLPFGTYQVRAESGGLKGALDVDLGSGGSSITIALSALKEIGSVSVARSVPVRGSGADVILNATDLTARADER